MENKNHLLSKCSTHDSGKQVASFSHFVFACVYFISVCVAVSQKDATEMSVVCTEG